MTDVGLEVIQAAQRDGSWETRDAADALLIPEDLAHALAANPQAEANFNALAPSAQKHFLWWIRSAKRPHTRARRITETVRLTAKNLTLASREPHRS